MSKGINEQPSLLLPEKSALNTCSTPQIIPEQHTLFGRIE